MAESRKTVTIVFADVTGSTALGEQTDPETMRRIMERYFEEMRAVLEKHGGTVEKFIGDAVMAVFGIPQVHEDDALRAVRAAAEMRDRLAALNEEFERERGVTIAVRTGVNTGEVVAGDPSQGQAFATGDAVNVAARLEQAAEPGQILIGPLTQRLVREAVRAEAVEPLGLKGKSAPAEAWRLLEVLPDVPAFTRRLDAPFIGRDGELAALHEAFERSRERGGAELITIVAPAGIGKSRLARELVTSVGGEARVVVGRCLPYGEGITYWPLAEIVRQVAGDDHERLLQFLEDEEDGRIVSTHLAAAVGFRAAASRNEEIAWAARRLLEKLARDRPVVVVIDDIHWAEETLLDLVEYVVGFAAAPILVLCLARPDLFDARPSWGIPRPGTLTVRLEPLEEDVSEALVDSLLSGGTVSEALRREIIERAEGNPLFVEQMLAHVRESGNGDVAVPPTIDALLRNRIDSLAPAERAVVERGAVEGRMFHRGAVVALLPETEQAGITKHLMALVRKELIRPDQTEFAGDDGFRFAHILVRDAAYAAVPKEIRAELHARFANWLEQRAAARLPEFYEILGYHLEQSFRYHEQLGPVDERTRELARLAADRLAHAGRRAAVRGDVAAAENLLERAQALLPVGDGARRDLLPDLVDVYLAFGAHEPAKAAIDEALEHARTDHERAAAEVLDSGLAISFDPEGASERAFTAAKRTIPIFEAAGDDRWLERAWKLVEQVHWQRGELSLCLAAAKRALASAERVGDLRAMAEHRSMIGAAQAFGKTTLDEGIAWAEQELEWAREFGVRWHEAMLLIALGSLRSMRQGQATHRTLIAEGHAILDDLGMKIVGAAIVSNWAQLLPAPTDSERELRRAYLALKEAGERGFLSTVAARLADAVYQQGRLEEASELTQESEAAGAADDVTTQVIVRAVRAKILAARGRADEAEELARDAVSRSQATEYFELRAEALTDLGEVLSMGGRPEDAAESLAAALRLYERKGHLLGVERTRAKLAELQSSGSPSQ